MVRVGILDYVAQTDGLTGINTQHAKYASNPIPTLRIKIAVITLMTVGSWLRYSAIPPQTPANFLLVRDLYSFFGGVSMVFTLSDRELKRLKICGV